MSADSVLEMLKSPFVTFFGGILVGIFIGVAGKYYADKFTDQRKAKEQKSGLNRAFAKCREQMPELFVEMKEDTANSLKREFVLFEVNGAYGAFPDKPLVYFMDSKSDVTYKHEKRGVIVHAELLHKVKMLESNGFVSDITRTSVPYFRMTEQFAQMLKDEPRRSLKSP